MFKSLVTSLLWRGILALAVGIVSVAWPGITIGAFVILFAVYALLGAGSDLERAFGSDRAGPVVGYLLLALVGFGAGLVALFWPGITALVLTVSVAVWAVVTGIIEISLAFKRGAAAGERAMWALGGLVSVALGVVLFVRPDVGAVTLATVFGIFTIAYGVTALLQWFRMRRLGKLAHRIAESAS
ncbi:HdeD family acid-resistance protein [Dactylosporangium sp. CA-233914]|uniref:HdeD family acid-resistance protein n=1 Tax=Dactylosporangium sp. CA-233914 TaxID=3239934 RepID=UPI003D9447BC